MKTSLQLLILALSITAAAAQDETAAPAQVDNSTPAVVYDTPVVYNSAVVYNAPVNYNAPVYYVSAAPSYVPVQADYEPDCGPVSTVTYIGGGHVAYQESRGSCGSTVTYIGHSGR